MSEAQTVPWKRISIEAVAIVVSILIAFAIDASWEERQSNTRRQELIRGLILDFEFLVENSREALSLADDLVSRNRALLELLASGGNADLEEIQQLLSSFAADPGRLQTSLPILDTALGADGVGSIQDPTFFRALTNFYDQREAYEQLNRNSADMFYRENGLFYRRRFGSIRALLGKNSQTSAFQNSYPREYEMTAEQIVAEFRKPELFGRLEHRYNANTNVRLFIVNIQEAADAALQALRKLE